MLVSGSEGEVAVSLRSKKPSYLSPRLSLCKTSASAGTWYWRWLGLQAAVEAGTVLGPARVVSRGSEGAETLSQSTPCLSQPSPPAETGQD